MTTITVNLPPLELCPTCKSARGLHYCTGKPLPDGTVTGWAGRQPDPTRPGRDQQESDPEHWKAGLRAIAECPLDSIGESDDGRPVYRREDVVAEAERLADGGTTDILGARRPAR